MKKVTEFFWNKRETPNIPAKGLDKKVRDR